jgi:hypothetical protein
MEEGSKEIVVECVDDGFKGFVETLASHTLHDLRQLLADEFDDDMLPTDYYFSCDDIRYSTKQEAKKRVWDLIDRDVAVRIHDKSRGQKRGPPSAAPDESNGGGDGNKKLRTSNDGRDTTAHVGTAADASLLVDSPVESSGAVQEEAKATRISTTPTSFGNLSKPTSAPEADKIHPATEAAASKLGTSASLFHEQEEGVTSHSNKSISAAESSNQRSGNDVERDPAFATTSVEETPVISNKSSDVVNKRYSSALSTVKKAILFASEPRVALPDREENSSPRLDDRGSASTGRIESTSAINVSESTTDTAESCKAPSTVVPGTSSSSLSSSASNHRDATNDSAESIGSTAGERPSRPSTLKPPSPSPPSSLRLSSPVGNANDDGSDDDDDDDVVSLGSVVSPLDDANAVQQEARDKSIQVLNDLQNLLKDNSLFCSQERREDLSDEIRERLASSAPRVVVGVLGSTGVGKSR